MARIDWLKLFLACPSPDGIPTLDRLSIQQGMFLLREVLNLPSEVAYEFEAWRNGPYSIDLQNDLEVLENEGVLARRGHGSNAHCPPTVELVEQARQQVAAMADPKAATIAEIIRYRLAEMTVADKLAALGAQYPDWGLNATEYQSGGSQAATGWLAEAFSVAEIELGAEILLNRRRSEGRPMVTLEELRQRLGV